MANELNTRMDVQAWYNGFCRFEILDDDTIRIYQYLKPNMYDCPRWLFGFVLWLKLARMKYKGYKRIHTQKETTNFLVEQWAKKKY
jgi:hypothetical protein